MKPMLPTLSGDAPKGDDWVYEVKYDGFRVLLEWSKNQVKLVSRNGNDLTTKFPEIKKFCEEHQDTYDEDLPLVLDGELVILNTKIQANFPLLQQRNRMGNKKRIQETSDARPVTFIAFDILKHKGKDTFELTLKKRRKHLESLSFTSGDRLQLVSQYETFDDIWEEVNLHLGEGVVAKRLNSKYREGERTDKWIKLKNWRVLSGILSSYNQENGYFSLRVYEDESLEELGSCKHGLSSEDGETLRTFFTSKGTKKGEIYKLRPSVCVDVKCLHQQKNDLREPMFDSFRFDLSPEECSEQKKQWDLAQFPDVNITHPDKVLWPKPGYKKRNLLLYMRRIAPYIMPFLKDKKLTVIRFPDGIHEESFFQKHLPDYAPDYVESIKRDGEIYTLCQNLSTLIWFGNQGALEYHVPFERVHEEKPHEIVFDLDPPSNDDFEMAVHAVQLFKHLLDKLELTSFVKTSGGKGMQIHIPIPKDRLTYDETRAFTEKLATLLVKQEPSMFTIERLKKNRGNRLYIDYVQHAEGKTIIAPYSPRGREHATVATPLYWDEVTESLSPTDFTIENVLKRVENHGCPFANYFDIGEQQNLEHIYKLIE
ncbi:DNA ligase D [Pontibacillus sp. HMF3514]|uniref:DNA ligase D n=1 Tax=Pontibacillus sp. HMF3514 TaxID=2692425 RepID=UPI00131F8E29|nr:DNA ligase D [Pontibacillus sp. HMF3514]QHE53921.1 DNA ligase D [Pontibacillus sp. HMF3514]